MDFGTQSMVSFAMIKGSAIGRGRRGEFSGYPGSANWPREEGRVRVSTAIQEAYVKAIGAGLGYGLDRLEFHHTNWTNISIHVDGKESRAWRFWLFDLGKCYWAGHRVTSLGASGYLFFAFCHKQNLGHPKAIGI